MFIITFLSTVLILSRGKARRIVDGVNVDGSNWDPFLLISKDLYESPNYDITHWVRQLHLQQCAFVEIGEGFCAVSRKYFVQNTFFLANNSTEHTYIHMYIHIHIYIHIYNIYTYISYVNTNAKRNVEF